MIERYAAILMEIGGPSPENIQLEKDYCLTLTLLLGEAMLIDRSAKVRAGLDMLARVDGFFGSGHRVVLMVLRLLWSTGGSGRVARSCFKVCFVGTDGDQPEATKS